MENKIQFGTLNQDGTITNKRELKQSNIAACTFFIMMPEHYRENGSCKCNNREHRTIMIREWKYSDKDFTNIPLID